MSLAAEQKTSQPEIRVNPVRDRQTWEQMRQEVIADPGLFHGNIAKRELHWFDAGLQAWINWDDRAGNWTAHSAATGEPLAPPAYDSLYEPWQKAFDDSEAPFYQWFAGG